MPTPKTTRKRTRGELLAAVPGPSFVYILSWKDPDFPTRSSVTTRSLETANAAASYMDAHLGKPAIAIERLRDPFPRATPRELPST